ncbi:MAG: molybdopterin-synthase adenylyltransferase MoeB [Planktomarina sp.]|jgi:molybdopterin/thiamine biosynthesis adenylyltransferase|nr:molybdopterin-synthase adenylyltransferase MoeB [Planktomarina sp.]
MILVGTMCAVLWSIGWAMNAPVKQRWGMISAVFVGVILSHLILPVAHPLRMNTGGSWQVWALLAAFVVVVLVYRQGLRKLRGKAQPERVSRSNAMSDTELDRYARHIVMPEIGGSGQMRLRESRVLVIGAGGLGAPALQYLAAAGVGTIGIVDDDVVDASNLQRQVIHRDADIGLPKVQSAAQALRDLNPYVTIKTFQQRFNAEIAGELIAEYDIILDGTDNFETRYLINKICVAQKRPLVSGALSQWEGQISLFDPTQSGPCYQCIFPSAPAPELAPSCSQVGVFTALPGVIGSLMAAEALKYLLGAGTPLLGRMAMYNVLDAQTRVIKTKQRADCPICHPS